MTKQSGQFIFSKCVLLTREKKRESLEILGLVSSEIHPVILAQVRVVDLSLSSEEIQGLMLTQLLQSQCKQLLMQHLQFQNDKQLLEDKVVSEEVRNSATCSRHNYKKNNIFQYLSVFVIWPNMIHWATMESTFISNCYCKFPLT